MRTRDPNALGRPDGHVTRDEAIAHCRAIAPSTPIPVSADLENGFGDMLETVAEIIERLETDQDAGADVLYAPALSTAQQVRSVANAIGRPLDVLLLPGGPTVPELFAAGAAHVSTGSAVAATAQGDLVQGARELLDAGTIG